MEGATADESANTAVALLNDVVGAIGDLLEGVEGLRLAVLYCPHIVSLVVDITNHWKEASTYHVAPVDGRVIAAADTATAAGARAASRLALDIEKVAGTLGEALAVGIVVAGAVDGGVLEGIVGLGDGGLDGSVNGLGGSERGDAKVLVVVGVDGAELLEDLLDGAGEGEVLTAGVGLDLPLDGHEVEALDAHGAVDVLVNSRALLFRVSVASGKFYGENALQKITLTAIAARERREMFLICILTVGVWTDSAGGAWWDEVGIWL